MLASAIFLLQSPFPAKMHCQQLNPHQIIPKIFLHFLLLKQDSIANKLSIEKYNPTGTTKITQKKQKPNSGYAVLTEIRGKKAPISHIIPIETELNPRAINRN